MTNLDKHYIFYDLETTGQNPCFDQAVRFAAVETDADLKIISSHNIDIQLRNDVLPHPKALLVNKLSIDNLENGDDEYEAFIKIHKLMNKPNTISIGYNSLNFDDIFLRFGFYRNLLDPYSHQYSNKFRADLYNIIFMYYLYKNEESIIWPMINNRLTLRLEQINNINHLYEGTSHDAEVDVHVTIELAKTLRAIDHKMWDYLISLFVKNDDRTHFNKLPTIQCIDDTKYKIGLFIGSKIGLKSNYCAPIIYLSEPSKDKIIVLRLDNYNFSDFNANNFSRQIKKGIISKKFGEPNFIIPFTDQYSRVLNEHIVSLAKSNLSWIKHNPESFKELVNLHKEYEYESIESIDLDASLYEQKWFSNQEKNIIEKFHNKNLSDKIDYTQDLSDSRIKDLATRIIGRNYYLHLSGDLKEYYYNYLKGIFYNESQTVDFRGDSRSVPSDLLKETKELLRNKALDSNDQNILNSLEKLISLKIQKQQDLGF